MNLRRKAKTMRQSKENTKWLMVELMKISSIDFTVEHMSHKLYKYGFGKGEEYCYKVMKELESESKLIFNGYKPVYVNGNCIGGDPVFGLIEEK